MIVSSRIVSNVGRFLSLLMVLALTSVLVPGKAAESISTQESSTAVTRIIRLKFTRPSYVISQLQKFYPMVQLQPNDELKFITARGPTDVLAALEQLIREHDVLPPSRKNIELTTYLLMTSDQAPAESRLPESLQTVVRQLRNTFSYKDYTVLETVVLRTRDGDKTEASGLFPYKGADAEAQTEFKQSPVFYSIRLIPRISQDEKGKMIVVDGFNFSVRLPIKVSSGQITYESTGINTNIDLREGQSVVVGKTSAGNTPSALILVIIAKVLE